ncbi:Zinc finger, C3HC4 type (RING finger) containing protein [Novymonas esmeraldas]|uniref:Zinc finger, C3HC4 type (RING finger) containing protein n=1 Tax=Novymonas esmeraldas TaxID=1808958 RepID=A0AAW0EJI7_9TRYP
MRGADYRCNGQGGGGGRCGNSAASAARGPSTEVAPVECLICADQCRAICVFPCGHYTCYSCGLRIHTLNKGSCPVCRKEATEMPIITQRVSCEEEQYSEEEMAEMRRCVTTDRRLRCVIDSGPLAVEMAKLYEHTCPLTGCWCQGFQDPFVEMSALKDHLQVDHALAYCDVCLNHRPAFLCEQVVYSAAALQQHLEGQCPYDKASFTGHPMCRFCKRANRFYDGEALLKHMRDHHYTCDVCNRGQFTFTFYATREKLNEHFLKCHKICDHPDCASLDLMMRVFGNEIDLMLHKQRVHGVKARVSFSPATFGEASSSSGGTGPAGAAPATASNTNAIQITFDHVFRVETADLMSSKAGRRRGGRGGDNAAGAVHAPEEIGIPPHYQRPNSLFSLTRVVASDGGAASPSARAAAASAAHGDHGRGGGSSSSFSAPSHPSAFGVAEDASRYHATNRLPTDKKALEQQLNELLSRHLRSPVAYANFRRYTRDFIDSAMLTSEYYNLLTCECFSDRVGFQEVFPYIISTMPVAEKKMALQEFHKMRMAPEMQRVARAREEDARKEAEEQSAAERAEELRRRNTGRVASTSENSGQQSSSSGGAPHGAPSPFGNKKGRKQNAWMTVDARSKLGGSSADTTQQHRDPVTGATTSTSAAAAMRQQANRGSSQTWGSALAATSGPPYANSTAATSSSSPAGAGYSGRGLVINEETFPSLPSNDVRRAPIGTSQKSKTNAWFKR